MLRWLLFWERVLKLLWIIRVVLSFIVFWFRYFDFWFFLNFFESILLWLWLFLVLVLLLIRLLRNWNLTYCSCVTQLWHWWSIIDNIYGFSLFCFSFWFWLFWFIFFDWRMTFLFYTLLSWWFSNFVKLISHYLLLYRWKLR